MSLPSRLHLFQAYGIELEYMIVDKSTLAVKPVTDELLKHELGDYGSEFENGMVTWSNELVLHVIELKSTRPESNFSALESAFPHIIDPINTLFPARTTIPLPPPTHPF